MAAILQDETLEVLELFGGIGAPRKALQNIGVKANYTYVENNPMKVNAYNAIYDENHEPMSVTDYRTTKFYHILAHGSPCQTFSKEGSKTGGDEGSGTKSSLMWETVRIIKECKPKIVLWENVENVLSKVHRHNFDKYVDTLGSLGYSTSFKVCAGDEHGGVPQRRKRIIVVSVLNETTIDFDTINWPKMQPLKEFVEISSSVVESFDLKVNTKAGVQTIKTPAVINLAIPNSKNRRGRAVEGGTIVPTLLTSNQMYLVESKVSTSNICDEIKNESKYLETETLGIDPSKLNARKLHPKEVYRLMGFDDTDYQKSKTVSSLNQLEAQAGDSIIVPILERVFEQLFK